MEPTAFDASLLGSASVGILLTVLGFFRWLPELCKQVRCLLLSIRTSVVASWQQRRKRDGESHELNLIIDEKMTWDKVRQLRSGLRVTGVLFLSWSVPMVVYAAMGKERRVSQTFEIIFTVSQIYLGAVIAWPDIITPKTLDLHYVVVALFFCSSGLSDPDHFVKRLLISNGGLILLNAVRRTVRAQRLPLFAIVNVGAAACFAGGILTQGRQHFGYDENTALFETIWVRQAALFQVTTSFFTCMGCVAMEAGFRSMTQRILELKEVQELLCAACAVLRSCCDVVVELDADGCFVDAATDLSSFLLRGAQPRCLRGLHLVDLIVGEVDRELFAARLQESKLQTIGLAENVQVSMQDGCGNLLRLELIWFQFSRLTGQRCITLGVREVSDSDVWGRMATPLNQSNTSLGDAADQETSSLSSGCSSIPEDMIVHSMQSSLPIVSVDALEPGMPIMRVSAGFRSQIGRLPLSAPMVKFIRQPDGFLSWATASGNALFNGDEVPEDREECQITLQMPSGHLVKARVKMILEEEPSCQRQTLRLRVGLLFLNARTSVPTHTAGLVSSERLHRASPRETLNL